MAALLKTFMALPVRRTTCAARQTGGTGCTVRRPRGAGAQTA